jgi:hypothetical protein
MPEQAGEFGQLQLARGGALDQSKQRAEFLLRRDQRVEAGPQQVFARADDENRLAAHGISGLLRGRGGTERVAASGQPAGADFVLLGSPLASLDPVVLNASTLRIAASGLGDSTPVLTDIANRGATLRPLEPVHPMVQNNGAGLLLSWKRRARGAWAWNDQVDIPLVEDAETYLVGIGPVSAPAMRWTVSTPFLAIDAATYATIQSTQTGQPVWVRQSGRHAMSNPLLLFTVP